MAEKKSFKAWKEGQKKSPRHGPAKHTQVEFSRVGIENQSNHPLYASIQPHLTEITLTFPDLSSAPVTQSSIHLQPVYRGTVTSTPVAYVVEESSHRQRNELSSIEVAPLPNTFREARSLISEQQKVAPLDVPRAKHKLLSPHSTRPKHNLPSPSGMLPAVHNHRQHSQCRPMPHVSGTGEVPYYMKKTERCTGPLPSSKKEHIVFYQGTSSSFSSMSDQDFSFMSTSSSTSSGRYPSHRVSPLHVHQEASPSRLPSAEEVEAAAKSSKRAAAMKVRPVHPLRPPPKISRGCPSRLLSPLEQRMHSSEEPSQSHSSHTRRISEENVSPKRHHPKSRMTAVSPAIVFQPITDAEEPSPECWPAQDTRIPRPATHTEGPSSGTGRLDFHTSPRWANFLIDHQIADLRGESGSEVHLHRVTAQAGVGAASALREVEWARCQINPKQSTAASQGTSRRTVRRPSALTPLNVENIQRYDDWLEIPVPTYPPSAPATKARGITDYSATFQQARTERREGRRSVRVPAYEGVDCPSDPPRNCDWLVKERSPNTPLTPRRRRIAFLAWLRGLFT